MTVLGLDEELDRHVFLDLIGSNLTTRMIMLLCGVFPLKGWVAAFAKSHKNGSLFFERTIEQTTGTVPLAPKTIATATLEDQ